MNRTGVLDRCDVCSGLVCCMMEEGRGCVIAPTPLFKREGGWWEVLHTGVPSSDFYI